MADVKQIQRKCLLGSLSPLEAVSQIDGTIGGITRVDFKNGIKFKLTNHNQMFALDHAGYPRRAMDKMYGMAVLAYFKAKQNGSMIPGEVHISDTASTKHHMPGIIEYHNKYCRN